MAAMNIQEIERRLGVPRANIRYYEKEGLLHPRRSANNYRDYSEEDLETLKKICLLRRLDMPVETIRAVQAGEVPLAEALARQERLLAGEAARLDRAQAVCRSMLDDQVTYAALEPARYEGSSFALPGQAAGQPAPPPEAPRRPPVEGAQWAFDPWQRYWARTLDLALTGAAAWAILTLGFRMSIAGMDGRLLQAANLFLLWAILLVLEPLLLCTWGTTPGKWLLGLELRSKEGKKLSFLQGLRRTWGVLWMGYGLNIPVYGLYRLYRSYQECRDNEPLDYDYEAENLYYSKVPGRWGLRAAGAAALSLAMLPVMVWCSLEALRPSARGEVTAAEFAENVNAVAESLNGALWVDEEGFRLSRTTGIVLGGERQESRRYGMRYEEEPAYTLELDGNGFVTGFRMEAEERVSADGANWTSLPIRDAEILTAAFRGAWCGGSEMLKGPVMDALKAPPVEWTGQPVRDGEFTLAITLESEGYDAADGGLLLPREGAEECWYRFVLYAEKS